MSYCCVTQMELALERIETWRECQIQFNPQFTAKETLYYVKEVCDKYDLGLEQVKELFDQVEEPMVYDIIQDDVFHEDDACWCFCCGADVGSDPDVHYCEDCTEGNQVFEALDGGTTGGDEFGKNQIKVSDNTLVERLDEKWYKVEDNTKTFLGTHIKFLEDDGVDFVITNDESDGDDEVYDL